MVEPMIYFAIGFLIASLFNLFLVPLVHNRAVRLTIRRLEASTPFSMAEIQAEKDQLRAEFAMANRRLEMNVEQLKAKTTTQLGELGKQAMVIEKLKTELNEKAAAQQALEARENTTRDQLQTSEAEYSQLQDAVAGKDSEVARLTAALNERALATDKQRLEIAALKTQIEQLRAQIEHAGTELSAAAARVREERKAAEVASAELAKERAKTNNFSGRIAQLERQLATQTAEGEKLRALAHAGPAPGRDQAREENAASSANERVENALLRERINDIAAEVARLTAALEGPGSPIETMLAAGGGGVGPRAANGEAAAAPHGDLVERIRALKSRVSRLNPQS